MADDSLTPEEQYNIAAHFIKSSPPGQVDKVAEEIMTLVPSLPEGKKAAGFAAFNLANGVPVSVPGQEAKLVLTKDSKVEGKSFLDSHSKQVYTVDHVTQTVTDAPPAEAPEGAFPESLEGLRTALQTALLASVGATFGKGEGASWGVSVLPKEGGLVATVSATKAKLSSFWAGRWLARYTITGVEEGSATLGGTLGVLTHYYEAGNVQLKGGKTWEGTGVSAGGEEALAAALVAKIEEWGAAYQTALEGMFETMGSTTLKELRRGLPITGKTMSWNLAHHQAVSSLGGAAKAAADAH